VLHALLCLLPAVALVVPLLARRYPGERMLVGYSRAKPIQWSRPRSSSPGGRRVVLAAVRGGLLIGSSLAVRPPPSPIATS
jgi:hypothetical protein